MRRRALFAAAGAALALWPAAGAAASPPNPQTLRAALADPVESSFVEAEVGTQGTLEGPFDVNAYVDYYRGLGTSQTDVQRALTYLRRDGFAGGYGRQWYRPRSTDLMGELVLVFGSAAGASASEQASKLRYQEDPGFQSTVDAAGLGSSAFAGTLTSYGYDWTVITFVKGNALYAVSRGSGSDYRTAGGLAQAQRAYAVAPSTLPLPTPPGAGVSFLQLLRLAAIAGIVLMLAIATVIAVIVFVILEPRRHPSAPMEAQAKP
jgi:hypothetical protein